MRNEVNYSCVRTRYCLSIGLVGILAGLILEFRDEQHLLHPATVTTRPKTYAAAASRVENLAQDAAYAVSSVAPSTEVQKPSALDYEVDAPLPPDEEEIFLSEVNEVFTHYVNWLNEYERNEKLSELNARVRRGVRSLLNHIRSPSQNDEQVRRKLSMVDYLTYRMAWDPSIREDVVALVKEPTTSITEQRYRASRIAENAELMAGLLRVDRELALETLAEIEDPLTRRFAAARMTDMLMDWQGLSPEAASNTIAQAIHNNQSLYDAIQKK
ncbi:hypothetical protein [Sorangium sp. So ce1389]|uniref:hypothetical protein n=1 Tax=Sorangium sp. So ce1389 TaxID=3133336 RepID=UPI003F628167